METDTQKIIEDIISCRNLPTLPGVALRILELTRDPDAEISDMAQLISTDPALSGKILKTVNSSFYGLSQTVSTITQALVILGFQSVRTLALGFSLVGTLNKAGQQGFDLMIFWRRCIYSAVAARILCENLKLANSEEAFLGALLQDIGVLACHTALGDAYGSVAAEADTHDKFIKMEQEKLGFNHQHVGRALAAKWALPPMLAEPVAFHHNPDKAGPDVQNMVRAVHLAWLAAEVFIQADPSRMLKILKNRGRDFFYIQPLKMERILETINSSAHEMAELFEVNIGRKTDTQSILDQAREELVNITLETQQQATQLQSMNEKLAEAATTDTLTGLANRKTLDDMLPEKFRQAKTDQTPISVIFIDADRFKSVNDTFGHAAGDEVLKRIAGILLAQCPDDLPCRYGGEEIVCVMPGVGLRDAAARAEGIRAAVAAEVFNFPGVADPVTVTVSIGVAGMEKGLFYNTGEQMVNYADKAMYDAKKSGRNTIRICPAGIALSA